jgi:hypothetical protein
MWLRLSGRAWRLVFFARQVQADANERGALLQAVRGRRLEIEADVERRARTAMAFDLARAELLPHDRILGVQVKPELSQDPHLVGFGVNVMLNDAKAPPTAAENREKSRSHLLAREVLDGNAAANVAMRHLEWSGEHLIECFEASSGRSRRNLRCGCAVGVGQRHRRSRPPVTADALLASEPVSWNVS